MKKEKKIKFLEISILLIIIIAVLIIAKLATTFLNDKTNESTSYKTENYEQNKYIMYEKNITESYIYKIPYQDRIDNENSKYEYYIKSTDNIINGITEVITIKYIEQSPIPEITEEENEELEEPIILEALNQDTIHNFCNSYNEIEYSYKFKCTYDNNTLILKNEFLIPNDSLKENKKNITIELNNKRLDLYTKDLDSKNITYIKVDKMP